MSSEGAVPVCYRHSDRETYVACVRCDKPICPDCMREAAVGFQCVDCVKEGVKAVRPMSAPLAARPRKASSGALAIAPLSAALRGNVTKALVALNIVAFLAEGIPGGIAGQSPANSFTARFLLNGQAIAYQHQYYRLITAAFLHADILHIGFNMLALYQIGTALERVIGTWRYLLLYFAAAIGGSVMSYAVHGVNANSLGASTAIFGIFGAFYMISRHLGGDSSQILSLIVINLVFTFAISSIDKFGHIGGLIVGGLVGLIYAKLRTKGSGVQIGLIVGIVVVLFAIAVVKTQTIHPVATGVFING